jgi:hypothetical protein
MQLYIMGLLNYRSSQHVAIRDLYEPTTTVRKINMKHNSKFLIDTLYMNRYNAFNLYSSY